MPIPEKIEVRRMHHDLKPEAVSTQKPNRQIILDLEAGISQEAAAIIPGYRSLQRVIERKRKQENRSYPEPANLAELVVSVDLHAR